MDKWDIWICQNMFQTYVKNLKSNYFQNKNNLETNI